MSNTTQTGKQETVKMLPIKLLSFLYSYEESIFTISSIAQFLTNTTFVAFKQFERMNFSSK